MQGSPHTAINYFVEGAKLIVKPGYRRFVLIPLLANFMLFIALTALLINILHGVTGDITALMPNWLTWLSWLLWPIVGFIFLVVYGYSFNIITNIIAAPFFGFLVEKIQQDRLGLTPIDEPLRELIPRTLQREMTKLWYFITRGIVVLAIFLLLLFIPGLNLIGTLIWTLWSVWCMSVQYMDYSADTNHVTFRDMRREINKKPLTSYSYGGIILVGSMIPGVNIFITPIAVAGAALYWINEVHQPTLLIRQHPSTMPAQ